MFNVNDKTGTVVKTITRKANAIKVAQRDGHPYVTNAETAEVVWGTKPVPAPTKPAKADKKAATERRPYRLTGEVAKADADRSVYVATAFDGKKKYDLTPAEDLEEGMLVVGRNKRNPVREIAELKVGKKWVTGYDANGHVFVYAPIGTLVPVRIDS